MQGRWHRIAAAHSTHQLTPPVLCCRRTRSLHEGCAMTMTDERRSSTRYPAVSNAAVVQFRRTGRVRLLGANLVNISRSGAMLLIDEKPDLDAIVYIRLEYPVRTPWITGTAVWLGEATA